MFAILGAGMMSCAVMDVVRIADGGARIAGRQADVERAAEQKDKAMREHIKERNAVGDWTCADDGPGCAEGFICMHEAPNFDTGVCRKLCVAPKFECPQGFSCSSIGEEDRAACAPDEPTRDPVMP